MNPDARIQAVTERIRARSRDSRAAYLAEIDAARGRGPLRRTLSCTNLAHGFAACPAGDKLALRSGPQPNIAIVSAYNDLLSAHQPLERVVNGVERQLELDAHALELLHLHAERREEEARGGLDPGLAPAVSLGPADRHLGVEGPHLRPLDRVHVDLDRPRDEAALGLRADARASEEEAVLVERLALGVDLVLGRLAPGHPVHLGERG